MGAILCSFSQGCYRVRSRSGKQGLDFDESEMFGPSLVNMRTGNLRMVPEKSWFWQFYSPWREAGRPTEGAPISTPNGPLHRAVWAEAVQSRTPQTESEGSREVKKPEILKPEGGET